MYIADHDRLTLLQTYIRYKYLRLNHVFQTRTLSVEKYFSKFLSNDGPDLRLRIGLIFSAITGPVGYSLLNDNWLMTILLIMPSRVWRGGGRSVLLCSLKIMLESPLAPLNFPLLSLLLFCYCSRNHLR